MIFMFISYFRDGKSGKIVMYNLVCQKDYRCVLMFDGVFVVFFIKEKLRWVESYRYSFSYQKFEVKVGFFLICVDNREFGQFFIRFYGKYKEKKK